MTNITKTVLTILCVAFIGICLRVIFGTAGTIFEVMSISFIFLSPYLLGFLTVILLSKEKVSTISKAFFMPFYTSLALLILTIILSLEGTICWILIYPLFSVFAGLGGISAFYWRKYRTRSKHDTLNTAFVIALLPIGLGYLEGDKIINTQHYRTSVSLTVNAPAATVWRQLTWPKKVVLSQQEYSLTSSAFSFPKHTETTLDTLAVGGHRKTHFEKGLYFDETILSYKPQQQLVLSIKADPESIPPNVLDEHVLVGGRHIQILTDTYDIIPNGEDRCKVTLISHYTVCTPFNWYASFWADLLIRDVLKTELAVLSSLVTPTS